MSPAFAQVVALEDVPGYRRYRQLSREVHSIGSEGRVSDVQWAVDGSAVFFRKQGVLWKYDLPGDELAQTDSVGDVALHGEAGGPRRPRVRRGAQRDAEVSPDSRWTARSRDWNVVIESNEDDSDETIVVTTDGHRKHRFGKASWVYGEELRQTDAMWWSPDSTKLAYYEFDERLVPDYHLTDGLTDLRTEVLIEGYPKAGDPNPIAKLWVFDLESRSSVAVDVGGGGDGDHYIYNVRFTQDGAEVLFSRTNRRQDVLELVAADVTTGGSRVVLTETQETWQHNRPQMLFLEDGRRFIWETERTGWSRFELRDLDGNLIAPLSPVENEYPVASIVHVVEGGASEGDDVSSDRNHRLPPRVESAPDSHGTLYYTAFSDPENPLNRHLHRVNLDGTDHRRLTDGPLNHTIELSPCARWFLSEEESAESPPVTVLYDTEGNRIETLAEASWARFDQMHLTRPELFSFTADDGETKLYGVLFKPARFDPEKEYPLLIDVYGGPWIQRVQNTWQAANPACEFGFLIAMIDNRGTPNRGKAFEDAAYMKLGDVDLRDQVAAVEFLAERPYVDGDRVGIYGGSYGGYLAALAMLKYPDVFHAGVAMSAVTDWRNYDTIYTERFMRLPDENVEGYKDSSCLTHAANLRGAMLIMHGMLDDNVHPANAWQLIHALDEADRPFDMKLFPSRGHWLGIRAYQMVWEHFARHLLTGE